ncbi:hypothetical protein J6590_075159 [Homalodisca vitripennis]|nr:hypothetical protein J6590_075159 [Homalodisca vitripennis]
MRSTECSAKQCTENTEVLSRLKILIEVLEAEHQCLKQQLRTCECADSKRSQTWTKVQNKKNSHPISTQNKFNILTSEIIKTRLTLCRINTLNHKLNHHKQLTLRQSPEACHTIFKNVTIKGDSHARYIAGLVGERISSATSVRGVCMPGVRLLDVIVSGRASCESGPSCEVLIAGTNDMAIGEQLNIYRHLETYIAAKPPSRKLVLATLPHRHDLDPNHPIHGYTALVNAFIEELAARYRIQVLNFDGISRRYFTRHGQHLCMRGKRQLTGEIIQKPRNVLHQSTRQSPRLQLLSPRNQPSRAGDLRRTNTSLMLRSSRDHLLRSKHDFNSSSNISPTGSQFFQPSQHQNSKFQHSKIKLIHQYAQIASNKTDELALLCEELNLDVFVVSEHGFRPEAIHLFKIPNLDLATHFCRNSVKGGGVAIPDAELPAVFVDEDLLEETNSMTFLGMLLDSELTWNNYVDNVCAKASSGIFALRKLAINWKFHFRESCQDSFKELGLLTLPCLYISEEIMEVHQYETRGRDNFRTQQRRLSLSQYLPQQVGVRLINRLPESLKTQTTQINLKHVSSAFWCLKSFTLLKKV